VDVASSAARRAQRVWDAVKGTYRTFRHTYGPQHAAAIAYFSLVSIVPFSALMVAYVARSPERVESLMGDLATAVPFLAGDLRDELEIIAARAIGIGVVSGLVLLLASTSIFTSINRGVNGVMGTKVRPRFLVTRFLSALIITGVGAVLVLWQVVRSWLKRWSESQGVAFPEWGLSELFNWSTGVVFFALAFYVVVRLVAKPKYRRRYFWAGALLFGVLSQLARLGLKVYLEKIWQSRDLYGGLGAAVGLMMWLYIAAYMLLMSCALVRTLGERRLEEESG